MISPQQLSTLIGIIYDAALDSGLWPDVLRKTSAFVGAQGAGLLSKSSVMHTGTVHYQVGVDPRYIELYETEMWRYDPISPLSLFSVGEVTSRFDYMADAEFLEGRFHREWARPQGWIDSANVVVEKSRHSFSILSYLRSEAAGAVDDDMRQRIGLLFPHIRRAVLIGNAINLKTAEVAQLTDVLDTVVAGVVLIDGARRVVYANRAGQQMLERGLLTTASGRLSGPDPAVDDALVAATSLSADSDKLGDAGVAVSIQSSEGRYILNVLPLLAGAREQIARRHSAVAAVFVVKSELQEPTAPEIIAAEFGLTHSEVRVLLAMVDNDGVAPLAAALGVSEATVHTHLARIYAKTGRRRQTELVKLLAEFSNPMLP